MDCPLAYMGGHVRFCPNGSCGWWSSKNNKCAITLALEAYAAGKDYTPKTNRNTSDAMYEFARGNR